MAHKLSIGNNKYRIGKTTTTMNIAGCLSKYYGKKVLVVDCDLNGNLTNIFIRDKNDEYIDSEWENKAQAFISALTTYATTGSLTEDAVKANVVHTRFENIDLLPIPSMEYAEKAEKIIEGRALMKKMLGKEANNNVIYRHLFKDVENDYDYILFDLPANFDGFYCLSALGATDLILIPVTNDYDSLRGCSSVIETINKEVRPNNSKIDVLGLFCNGYKDVSTWRGAYKKLEEFPASYIVPIKIRNSEIVASAKIKNAPVCYYRENAAVCKDYILLTEYVMRSFLDDFEKKN